MRPILFVLAITLILKCASQSKDSTEWIKIKAEKRIIQRHTVFAELLGNAGLGFYSINYDYILPFKNNGGISFRAGGSVNREVISCPVLLNFVAGRYNSHFEIGFGADLLRSRYSKVPGFYVVPTANLTYRHQKPEGGVFYKIGYTPVFHDDNSLLIIFWASCGLAIGYTF
jgi:hypothetical protein